MNDFLPMLLAGVKARTQRAKQDIPPERMAALAQRALATRPPVSLSRALAASANENTPAIIAEIKRASPSKGDIAPNLNAAATARAYEQGGAVALSVLTEETYFKGSLGDIKALRSLTPLPILRKEFITESYQILEAAKAGADAVLLIARILDKKRLSHLLDLTQDLGMEALVEVFDMDDIDKIKGVSPPLVGINNRNLKTFDTDTLRAARLARHLPPTTSVVAASGITGPRDIARHLEAGISAFLVGEALVRAKDSVSLIQEMIRIPKSKIHRVPGEDRP